MGVILRERYRKIANATQKVKCNARVISVANSNECSILYQLWVDMPKKTVSRKAGCLFWLWERDSKRAAEVAKLPQKSVRG